MRKVSSFLIVHFTSHSTADFDENDENKWKLEKLLNFWVENDNKTWVLIIIKRGNIFLIARDGDSILSYT